MQQSSNADSWFVARDGESQGPFTWAQLRSAVRQGKVKPRDWIWRSGMRRWVRAEEQEGLIAATPPPVPADDDSSPDLQPEVIHSVSIEANGDGPTTFARPPSDGGAGPPGPPPPPKASDAQFSSSGPPGPVSLDGPVSTGMSLGETTRQFLAAAGVSAKVRRRRRRQATGLAVLGIAVLVGGGLWGSEWEDVEDEEPPVAAVADEEGQERPTPGALDRRDACRLTGDCRRAARRGSGRARKGARERPAGRRGDVEPSRFEMGALTTSGGGQAALGAKPAVKVESRETTEASGLSETQTFIVKKKVTPGLRNCGGVYAKSKVVIEVSTNGEGKVSDVTVRRGPSRVRRCLKRRARYWRFGRALADRKIQLTIPAKAGVVRVAGIDS